MLNLMLNHYKIDTGRTAHTLAPQKVQRCASAARKGAFGASVGVTEFFWGKI